MKSFAQMILLLGVLVAGVFGLTFMTQFSRTPIEKAVTSAGPAVAVAGSPLKAPETRAVWDVNDEDYAAEFEVGTKGHYDFWVSNLHPKPVITTVETKSCVCSQVQVGLLPASARAEYNGTVAALATAFDFVGAPNLAATLAFAKLPSAIDWTTMTVASASAPPNPVRIPAADSNAGPQLAIVRLGFDGKEAKSLRLASELRVAVVDGPPELIRFDVPTVIVPPVIIAPGALQFGTLGPNDVRELHIFAWSPTRSSFRVTAEEALHDPCIDVRPPRPLRPDELRTLPLALRQAGIASNTRMKSGYEIVVAVHERRDGKQLELGPLNRKIGVRTTDWPETPIIVSGVVRGSIRVGEGSDQDRINLGSFRSKDGVDKTLLVTGTEAGLDLRLKSKTPDYLSVTLEPIASGPGLKQWKLTVGIDPEHHSGFLPAESAVYLETKSDPPRSIRIPVVGNATR
ncbi:MAG: hypothetical protein U0746_00175 [Gemmataceae bacterium]